VSVKALLRGRIGDEHESLGGVFGSGPADIYEHAGVVGGAPSASRTGVRPQVAADGGGVSRW